MCFCVYNKPNLFDADGQILAFVPQAGLYLSTCFCNARITGGARQAQRQNNACPHKLHLQISTNDGHIHGQRGHATTGGSGDTNTHTGLQWNALTDHDDRERESWRRLRWQLSIAAVWTTLILHTTQLLSIAESFPKTTFLSNSTVALMFRVVYFSS